MSTEALDDTPFGLTMMTSMRDRSALPELSGATLDPATQLGMDSYARLSRNLSGELGKVEDQHADNSTAIEWMGRRGANTMATMRRR